VILLTFPNYEKIAIYPRTKKLMLEDGIVLYNTEVKIIECRIGGRLFININNQEEYESEFDIYKIKVKKRLLIE
jgi:hypothetical protein